MDFDWNGLLNGAIGAGILGLLRLLYDLYLNRNKPKIDNAEASKIIVEGGTQAVKMMRELLDDYDKRNDELEARLAEREKQSAERDTQLAEMEKKYEEMEARIKKDTDETQRLRGDYAVALKQIIRLEDLAIGLGEYVDTILTAVKKAGVDIPLNGGLMESVLRLKAERAKRGREGDGYELR